MSWSKITGDRRTHFLDPDRDSLGAVVVLRDGDVIRVLFREEDVVPLFDPPSGLERTLQDSVTLVNTRDGHSQPAEWVTWVALVNSSVRLDRLIDPTFRHYRESLEEFYTYRAQLIRGMEM